ncbi:MAG: PD-(D/E)XK nuclease family protein [Verrucomicrobia bacterium]|nr:PD-(D/E)XK nuclease family protein [Verrucomicrobiota bacterium]
MPAKRDKFAEKHEQDCFWSPAEIGVAEEKTEGGIVWSFSTNRLFKQCQRQWFYKSKFASALAKKNPERREAYLLSKLGSVQAWRGKLVDKIIEDTLVPVFRMRRVPKLGSVLDDAMTRFDRQLRFGMAHHLRDPGFMASEHETGLAAFYGMEYGSSPTDSEIKQAREEVELALTNLLEGPQFEDLRQSLLTATQLTPQCTITFQHAGVSVRAVPDLICFYEGQPPLIIDWKVHHFAIHDYYAQLVCYALALTRCSPHASLPTALKGYPPHEVRLVEAQLLTAGVRRHEISEDAVLDVEDKMAVDINAMLLAVDARENAELTADDFPMTTFVGACDTCNFRKMCWRT